MKSVNQAINESGLGRTPKMEFIKYSKCEECGNNTKIFDMEIMGGDKKGELMRVAYGCVCKDRELAKQAVEGMERLKKARLLENFETHSMINKDLKNASFDSYVPENEKQDYAKRTAERYIEMFDLEKPKNISFHGNFGVGKSHLAKCITDGVMDKGYTAIFITVPTLLRKIRATYNNDSSISEDRLFTVLEKIDLLVLDDLGREKDSEFALESIFTLINARQGMHTIYTTNYSPADLRKIFGDRDYGRMAYNTEQIEIRAENYRLKKK